MHLPKIVKLRPNEQVVITLRRHPFVLVPSILIFLLTQTIGIGAFILITTQFANIYATDAGRALTVILISLLLLSAWLQIYGHFVDYYLDMWVVTNTRIINVEQTGLFGKTVSETDLYKVQDVTSSIEGFFPTTFNFGFVHIQSAGEVMRFVFEEIPAPHVVRKTIIDLVQHDRKRHALEALASEPSSAL